MERTTSRNRAVVSRLLSVAIGWALSRSALSAIPGRAVFGVFLHPAAIAPAVVLIATTGALLGRRGPGWAFFAAVGWIADAAVFLAVRPGRDSSSSGRGIARS